MLVKEGLDGAGDSSDIASQKWFRQVAFLFLQCFHTCIGTGIRVNVCEGRQCRLHAGPFKCHKICKHNLQQTEHMPYAMIWWCVHYTKKQAQFAFGTAGLTEALLDTPAWQCTNTLPPVAKEELMYCTAC